MQKKTDEKSSRRNFYILIVSIFVFLSIVWQLFHAVWRPEYISLDGSTYLLNYQYSPFWDKPPDPPLLEFKQRFPDSQNDFVFHGEIRNDHKWPDWFLGFFVIWFFGGLILGPLGFARFRNDLIAGSIARMFLSLVAGFSSCLFLYLIIGGWGPPVPLAFCVFGLLAGFIWTVLFIGQKVREQ